MLSSNWFLVCYVILQAMILKMENRNENETLEGWKHGVAGPSTPISYFFEWVAIFVSDKSKVR
jgi:hypothetical protein